MALLSDRRLRALLAVLACAAAAPVTQAPAAPPTVAGTVTGALPPRAEALTQLRVLDVSTATVVAATTAGRRGAFRLALAPGAYVLLTTITPERGRPPAAVRRAIGLTLAPGQRRTRVRIARPRRAGAKAAGTPTARAAYTQETGAITPGTLAFSVEHFTGATGDFAVLNRGLSDVLAVELADTPCRTLQVVNTFDRGALKRERNLTSSPYFDPKAVPGRNYVLADIVVTGLLQEHEGSLRYSLALTDNRTGAILEGLKGTLPEDRILESVPALARQVADRLCAYAEVFEVTFTGTGAGTFPTHSATGTLSAAPITAVATERDARGPTRWQGQATLSWTDVAVRSNTICGYANPVSGGGWKVTLSGGAGPMQVAWEFDQGAVASVTAVCPYGGQVPGQPATSLVGVAPMTFELPSDGRQPITGGMPGSGWSNQLEMRVRTVRVQRL